MVCCHRIQKADFRHYSRLDNWLSSQNITELLFSDYIESAIDHSQVDGAVIITNQFDLLGFGAEIRVSQTPELNLVLNGNELNSEESIKHIESYGTRHRSATRFCAKHTNSLIFTVSEDGSIRMFMNDNTKIQIYDIN